MKPELTSFEISIIVLVTQAFGHYLIAAKKGISYSSVKICLSNIYRKLGFPKTKGSSANIIRLTHYAIQHGYIQVGQCLS